MGLANVPDYLLELIELLYKNSNKEYKILLEPLMKKVKGEVDFQNECDAKYNKKKELEHKIYDALDNSEGARKIDEWKEKRYEKCNREGFAGAWSCFWGGAPGLQ